MAASLPLQVSLNESSFESQLRGNIRHFKNYEDRSNQLQALSRVPLEDLRAIAQAKYESSEKPTTALPQNENDIVKDMLLMELMDWFKNDFFSWMNSPPCPRCNKPTEGIGSGVPTSLEMSMSASRVEIFTCKTCFSDRREVARFPRYNNPVVLLDTRKGRCGEWANCFALICRSAGFEVRHVHDYTDHVWVEIYSSSLNPNRWVHVDPCENSYDNPLLYEVGWGKKLTYIIAVSQDDIQDVTPRYTKDLKGILPRRKTVSEAWLASTIVKLRNEMQRNLPENRKKEIEHRWVLEIVELITPKVGKDIKDSEKVGRESGSLAWRLARQEIGGDFDGVTNLASNFVWKIGPESVFNGNFEFNYDSNLDAYVTSTKEGKKKIAVSGWQNGAFFHEDIFKKEENDWKMVYLATRGKTAIQYFKENSVARASKICWKFQIDPSYAISDVQVNVKYRIFQSDAKFSVNVIADDTTTKNVLETSSGDQVFSWNSKYPEDINFKSLLQKSKTFTVICELKSGSGNEGWQKVQLFRQGTTGNKTLSALNQNILNISFSITKLS